MGLSRHEVNLRRLLAKCELLSKGKQSDERFPKYVASLELMLKDILRSNDKPQEDTVNEYKKRIYNLKIIAGLEEESDKQFLLNENVSTDRDELLGVRQRNVQKVEGLDDLEEAINYHQNIQEKIANDMLSLTQSLKEQSQLANKIIKKDTEAVGRSAHMTEQNFTKLKSESEKLGEHSKRACKCWMWMMLLLVLVIFVIDDTTDFDTEGSEEESDSETY